MPCSRECIRVTSEKAETDERETHRSGDTSLNSVLFAGFTCDRSEAVSTNWPTVLANLRFYHKRRTEKTHKLVTHPARNALNG